jgi:hypothetical protein
LVDAPERVTEIIENYEYTGDCFDNGHSIDNWLIRSNNMCNLFADRIAANGNVPNAGPCGLSLGNTIRNNFAIYPNPSDGYFQITSLNGELYDFKIYNSQGKIQLEGNTASELNLELNPGLYLIHIFNANGQGSIEKIIIY